MTAQERAALAEQLLGNPLFHDILAKIERDATEALIFAMTENDRVTAQWRVRAARTFRADCEADARNTQPRRGAPA